MTIVWRSRAGISLPRMDAWNTNKTETGKVTFFFTREASFSGRKLVMDSPWNLFCVQFAAGGGLPQIMAELNIREPYMVLEVSILYP